MKITKWNEKVSAILDTMLEKDDAVDFVCDFYDYNMQYQDSYYLGEQWVVEDPDNVLISNVDVGEGEVHVTYRFTDIYNQHH